jgi:DNA-binding NarL/FixJ family response regulator
MKDPSIRALIIDPDGQHSDRLVAAIAEVESESPITLERLDTADQVPERVAEGAADVVVLPLPQPDHEGVLPALELRASVPRTPLVILCRPEYEPIAIKAMQLGASDYLLTDRLFGTLVSRCLRHAVEVERVRARLARYDAGWASALRDETQPEVRAAPLRSALPEGFDKLVAEYRSALELAVERILHAAAPGTGDDMLRLARRAGRLGASPRDVIEIHTAVLKEKEAEEGPQRARLFQAEGRLRLLELMGHLVTYYRDLVGIGRPHAELGRPEAGRGD